MTSKNICEIFPDDICKIYGYFYEYSKNKHFVPHMLGLHLYEFFKVDFDLEARDDILKLLITNLAKAHLRIKNI